MHHRSKCRTSFLGHLSAFAEALLCASKNLLINEMSADRALSKCFLLKEVPSIRPVSGVRPDLNGTANQLESAMNSALDWTSMAWIWVDVVILGSRADLIQCFEEMELNSSIVDWETKAVTWSNRVSARTRLTATDITLKRLTKFKWIYLNVLGLTNRQYCLNYVEDSFPSETVLKSHWNGTIIDLSADINPGQGRRHYRTLHWFGSSNHLALTSSMSRFSLNR